MDFFGAIGWAPSWARASRTIELQMAALSGLVGSTVSGVWGVWNAEDDLWMPDYPVVVVFADGLQFEICWQKFDDLAITWNAISLGAPLPRPDDGRRLEWRPLAGRGFDPSTVMGTRLTGVEIVEMRDLLGPGTENSEPVLSPWTPNGVVLRTISSAVHIFDALDENGIDHGSTMPSGCRLVNLFGGIA